MVYLQSFDKILHEASALYQPAMYQDSELNIMPFIAHW